MRALCRRSASVAITCVAVVAISWAEGVDELDDAVARMQYAFFSSETRGVEEAIGIVQKVELPASSRGLKQYFTAYGHWKLAELHTDAAAAGPRAARGLASKAAAACVRAAQDAQTIDARLAEAFAIEAACSSVGSRLPNALSGGCAKHKGLRTAQELAPNNPRVLLIAAQCADGAGETGATQAIERLRQVVQAFEVAPPARPGWPDWGQAEALLMLGHAYLSRGDSIGARDPLERALVIAPDYRKAREALDKASARSTARPQ